MLIRQKMKNPIVRKSRDKERERMSVEGRAVKKTGHEKAQ